MVLKELRLTCVEYEEGQILSLLLAFSQIAPAFIFTGTTACCSLAVVYDYRSQITKCLCPNVPTTALATLCLFRRELTIYMFFVGQLLDTLANFVLKRAFQHPRPLTAKDTDFGMPSNHSQFLFFFATYYSLFLLFRYAHCLSIPSILLNNNFLAPLIVLA